MKKSLLALAALTAFAGAASAQSSVTLFGIVDLSARSVKNGSTEIKSLSTSGNATSRLGFRGVEDLGGGLRAGFWLEGELFADTGNPAGQNWQRRSTVSLLGGFGEIRLGRDYTPTFWNHTLFDPFGTNGVGSQTNLMEPYNQSGVGPMIAGATTRTRASNSIGYFLPAMGGVYGQLMVSAAEGPANGNKYIGGRLGYAAGPVNVAVAYGRTETPVLATTPATPTRDLNAANIGASYNFGFMTLFGQYHLYELDSASTFRSIEQKNALLGATVPIGAGTIKASYGKVASDRTGSADQIAVGYVYDLSKRTAVYAHGSRIENKSGARYSVGGNAGSAGSPAFGGTSNTPNSTGYEFGVRHSF